MNPSLGGYLFGPRELYHSCLCLATMSWMFLLCFESSAAAHFIFELSSFYELTNFPMVAITSNGLVATRWAAMFGFITGRTVNRNFWGNNKSWFIYVCINNNIGLTSTFLLECVMSVALLKAPPSHWLRLPTTSRLFQCTWETLPSWNLLIHRSSTSGGKYFHGWPGSLILDSK